MTVRVEDLKVEQILTLHDIISIKVDDLGNVVMVNDENKKLKLIYGDFAKIEIAGM